PLSWSASDAISSAAASATSVIIWKRRWRASATTHSNMSPNVSRLGGPRLHHAEGSKFPHAAEAGSSARPKNPSPRPRTFREPDPRRFSMVQRPLPLVASLSGALSVILLFVGQGISGGGNSPDLT